MAVCERCGNVGGGVTCALCGAVLPAEPDQTVVREWGARPDAAASWESPPTQVAPAVGGWGDPGAQPPAGSGWGQSQPTPAWPAAAAPQPAANWAPRQQRRRPVLPIVAGVLAVTLVGLAVWQLPGVLGRSQAASPSAKPATVTVTAGAATTPAVPATIPQAPATIPAAQPAGTYSGLARQAGGTVQARVWSVVLGFDGSARGTIAYATAVGEPPRCVGTLTQRADGQWVEHITSGGCDDGGVWSFAGSNPLKGAYTDPGGGYGVTGEFYYNGE